MSISKKIRDSIERSSWIRKMFEEGDLRKARYGPENIFDFSLVIIRPPHETLDSKAEQRVLTSLLIKGLE